MGIPANVWPTGTNRSAPGHQRERVVESSAAQKTTYSTDLTARLHQSTVFKCPKAFPRPSSVEPRV